MLGGKMSSSHQIIKSLQSESHASADKSEHGAAKEDYAIFVPQKCYAYITPETPKHINALYTDGLNTCSGIIVKAQDNYGDYIFLCHADAYTDLSDNSHGIPGWVTKIPSNLQNITIYYDNVDDGLYKDLIEKIIKHENLRQKNISVMATEADQAKWLDMVIFRGEVFNRNTNISFERVDAIKKEFSPISEYISEIADKINNQHPPICIFDSKQVLSFEKIKTDQPWVKAVIESTQNDSQSDEEEKTHQATNNPG
jgi:hypothetical protein